MDSPIERLRLNLDLFLMFLLPFGEKVRMRGVLLVSDTNTSQIPYDLKK